MTEEYLCSGSEHHHLHQLVDRIDSALLQLGSIQESIAEQISHLEKLRTDTDAILVQVTEPHAHSEPKEEKEEESKAEEEAEAEAESASDSGITEVELGEEASAGEPAHSPSRRRALL